MEKYKNGNKAYLQEYRAKVKQTKEQTKNTFATTVPSAIRNTLAGKRF